MCACIRDYIVDWRREFLVGSFEPPRTSQYRPDRAGKERILFGVTLKSIKGGAGKTTAPVTRLMTLGVLLEGKWTGCLKVWMFPLGVRTSWDNMRAVD